MTNYRTEVNWKRDWITCRFLERPYPFSEPSLMTPQELCETMTYIVGNRNPYAEELCDRAGLGDEYKKARFEDELGRLVRQAAGVYDIKIY